LPDSGSVNPKHDSYPFHRVLPLLQSSGHTKKERNLCTQAILF